MDEAKRTWTHRESPLLWVLYFLAYVSVLGRMIREPSTMAMLAQGIPSLSISLVMNPRNSEIAGE
jgi:hypothetical protein